MKTLAVIAALALFVSGCATAPGQQRLITPIVDLNGVNDYAYQNDLVACNGYARRISVGDSAAASAIAGALIGVLLAPHGYRGNLAGTGAAIGAAGGAGRALETQEVIVKRCLIGRGYNVLY